MRYNAILSATAGLVLLCGGLAAAQVSETELERYSPYRPVAIGNDVYWVGYYPAGTKELKALNLYRLAPGDASPRTLLSVDDAKKYLHGTDLTVDVANGRLLTASIEKTRGDGANCLVLIDPALSAPVVLVDNNRHNEQPAFSPDGKTVAFFSARRDIAVSQFSVLEGYALHVVDVATKAERELTKPDAFTTRIHPPVWSPDGDWIAFWAAFGGSPDNGHTYVIHPDGTGLKTIGPETPMFWPSGLVWPEKNRLLFVQDGVDGIHEMNLTGRETKLVKPGNFVTPLEISPDRKLLKARFIEGPLARNQYRFLDTEHLEPAGDIHDRVYRGNWKYPKPDKK